MLAPVGNHRGPHGPLCPHAPSGAVVNRLLVYRTVSDAADFLASIALAIRLRNLASLVLEPCARLSDRNRTIVDAKEFPLVPQGGRGVWSYGSPPEGLRRVPLVSV